MKRFGLSFRTLLHSPEAVHIEQLRVDPEWVPEARKNPSGMLGCEQPVGNVLYAREC
jgi:hypothetical protein